MAKVNQSLTQRKRGGKPGRGTPKKKRAPKPNPLDVQTNALIAGQVKPYQGLLNSSQNMAADQNASISRLNQGTQNELGSISTGLTSGYGALAQHFANAQKSQVQSLADNAGFLRGVLGGDFAASGLDHAQTAGNASNVQDSSSARMAGESALGDIARSQAAATQQAGEWKRDAGQQWDSRQAGLRNQIASTRAMRPYLRSQLHSRNLDDQLAQQAAALSGRQVNAGIAHDAASLAQNQSQFDATLAANTAEAGAKADATAGKDYQKQMDKYRKAAQDVFQRYTPIDFSHEDYDDKGKLKPGRNKHPVTPNAPLRTYAAALINEGQLPPDMAAMFAVEYTRGRPATWGAGANRKKKAKEILSLLGQWGVSKQVAQNILNAEYRDLGGYKGIVAPKKSSGGRRVV